MIVNQHGESSGRGDVRLTHSGDYIDTAREHGVRVSPLVKM
jgi:hypothetical protein